MYTLGPEVLVFPVVNIAEILINLNKSHYFFAKKLPRLRFIMTSN